MFELTESKKTEVWKHMLELPKSIRPRGLSNASFAILKLQVWEDVDFWQAVIGGHGINLITLEELKARDSMGYEDFLSNFFRALYQITFENKPTKPHVKF